MSEVSLGVPGRDVVSVFLSVSPTPPQDSQYFCTGVPSVRCTGLRLLGVSDEISNPFSSRRPRSGTGPTCPRRGSPLLTASTLGEERPAGLGVEVDDVRGTVWTDQWVGVSRCHQCVTAPGVSVDGSEKVSVPQT